MLFSTVTASNLHAFSHILHPIHPAVHAGILAMRSNPEHMAQLEKLGITEIEALGQPFDPALHNAVMHIEDENFGENTVAEVFQAGFRLGDKVVRFAMVKVAN